MTNVRQNIYLKCQKKVEKVAKFSAGTGVFCVRLLQRIQKSALETLNNTLSLTYTDVN